MLKWATTGDVISGKMSFFGSFSGNHQQIFSK